jgi:hypothetical protein
MFGSITAGTRVSVCDAHVGLKEKLACSRQHNCRIRLVSIRNSPEKLIRAIIEIGSEMGDTS